MQTLKVLRDVLHLGTSNSTALATLFTGTLVTILIENSL